MKEPIVPGAGLKLPIEKQKELFKKGLVQFTAQKPDRIKPKLYKIRN